MILFWQFVSLCTTRAVFLLRNKQVRLGGIWGQLPLKTLKKFLGVSGGNSMQDWRVKGINGARLEG